MTLRPEPVVGILAPMAIELAPLVRQLRLVADGELLRGELDGRPVLAAVTMIGMAPAEAATRRLLDAGADWAVVVGIAGAVDRSLRIGDVVIPSQVVDRRTGQSFEPTILGGCRPHGVISCGDDLVTDAAAIAALSSRGVLAVDMETAAVAAVCAAAGVRWTAFRAISDFAGDPGVDDGLLAVTRPDGSADPDALARYLSEDPRRAELLQELARNTHAATEAAAAAAIAALTS